MLLLDSMKVKMNACGDPMTANPLRMPENGRGLENGQLSLSVTVNHLRW